MAKTKISDVIVPELFAQYILERTTETSKLIQSGVVTANSELDRLVNTGGLTLNMPFWNYISGEDEVLSDSVALTADKIAASKDVACLLLRGKAWSTNDLAGALAGSDPMKAIRDMIADWWNEREQKVALSVLSGVFSSASMSAHILDKATGNITAEVILDGKQKLGDAAPRLQTLAMHSAVYTELQKQNLIAFVPNSQGTINMPTYLGYNVLYDDSMPVDAGVYTTYMLGNGVLGRGQGQPESFPMVELDRDSLAGDDIIVNRKALTMHPFGVKWIGTAAGATPSNAELATGTNWQRVYDSKNVPMVSIKHKLGA